MYSLIRNGHVVIFVVIAVTATFTLSEENGATCGVLNKAAKRRSFEGQNFEHGDYPWIIALMHAVKSPPDFLCGGTLISPTFVITAARCFQPTQLNESILPRNVLALFGAHDLNNCSEPERIVLSPERIIIHEDWNPKATEFDADLALLEFSAENIMLSTAYIQPVCLWSSDYAPPVIEGIVTGWAKTEDPSVVSGNEPKVIEVQIKPNNECDEVKQLLGLKSDQVFCVGLQNSSGICHGDRGGGLFVNMGGIYFLKGIRSPLPLADDGCVVHTNDVYTNVLKFGDWIHETTQVYETVPCSCETKYSLRLGAAIKTCEVSRAIDDEKYVLQSELDTEVQSFSIKDNKQVEFIPRQIGKKFPYLKSFVTSDCSLTILRNFYFKSMKKVLWMDLSGNNIATVEAGAFKELISVEWLELDRNRIETLDAHIFATMVNLEKLYLFDNKIKSLNPTTFEIPGGKLQIIALKSNVCINGNYGSNDLDRLKPYLETHCQRE